MPKPKYKYVNPLIDDHRSLENIFEQAKMKHYSGLDPDQKAQDRETKAEKKHRIKKEQVRKHNETLKAERKKCK